MRVAKGRHRVGLLSFSQIVDDPRVRRQGDALAAAGYDVAAVGLGGGKSASPSWPILAIDAPSAENFSGMRRWAHRARWISASLHGRIMPQATISASFQLDPRLGPMLERARTLPADIWIANDWNTLPAALWLASEQGAHLIYDTHELATEEYSESLRWRLFNRPFRRALEVTALPHAKMVMTVSEGISRRLEQIFGLAEAPLVVRNVPAYRECVLRPAGKKVRALYHGGLAPGRGLEENIASVEHWRPEFSLTIRGSGDRAYLDHLKECAARSTAASRIEFVPPVPMVELVTEANAFDIGLFALPGHSMQNTYALPNKLFEYTMAGLAVCVTDLPEMTRLVERYELGRTISGSSPLAIAKAINAFDRGSIDTAKANSLRAARELCWEIEQKTMIEHIDRIAQLPRARAETRG